MKDSGTPEHADGPAPPRRPQLVVALNITHAKVEKVADDIGIARWRGDDFRLVIGTAASTVDCQPDVGEPKKRWLAFAQNCGA